LARPCVYGDSVDTDGSFSPATSPPVVPRSLHVDDVEADVAAGVIGNVTEGREFRAEALPEFVLDITRAYGLVPWARAGPAAASR
jgi:hypothetical protein